MRNTIVLLLSKANETIEQIVFDVINTLIKAPELVRPERKFQRNHKRAQRKYCLNYKPTL